MVGSFAMPPSWRACRLQATPPSCSTKRSIASSSPRTSLSSPTGSSSTTASSAPACTAACGRSTMPRPARRTSVAAAPCSRCFWTTPSTSRLALSAPTASARLSLLRRATPSSSPGSAVYPPRSSGVSSRRCSSSKRGRRACRFPCSPAPKGRLPTPRSATCSIPSGKSGRPISPPPRRSAPSPSCRRPPPTPRRTTPAPPRPRSRRSSIPRTLVSSSTITGTCSRTLLPCTPSAATSPRSSSPRPTRRPSLISSASSLQSRSRSSRPSRRSPPTGIRSACRSLPASS